MNKNWLHYFLIVLVGVPVALLALVILAAALVYPSLPDLDVLTDYRPKMPLRVYSEDGSLLAEFGEEKRSVVKIDEVPLVLRQAIMAAEDERFYEHGGVDTLGVLRAAMANIVSGGVKEGASTITMQVARNFFLSSDRTFRRKLNEAMLAIKIEHTLSKDEIFELYINQIYLGQRAYGFATAARTYFGKPIGKITVAEAAMLAGLPKAPSAYNPVVNPPRARTRQLYVLRRMQELGYISETEFNQAKGNKLKISGAARQTEVLAGHLAEMARQQVYERYGDQIYTSGMKVYTTVRLAEQKAAEEAVRAGVVAYCRRHGYPGPEAQIQLPADPEELKRALADALARPPVNGLMPGVVMAINKQSMKVRLRSGEEISLGETELSFARNALLAKSGSPQRLQVGSLVRVVQLGAGQPWRLAYLPAIEAALVSISPSNGAIRALVGGFDFARNQFNHITQGWRQPGSSFKPFVYSAALERGVTPATVFNDAPLDIDPSLTGDEVWSPKNYDGTMEGPMTVRRALAKSKNLVSVRVLRATGLDFAQEHAVRFGFTSSRIPPYMTMALGAGEATPMQLAAAYAVFANGGSLPKPYFLSKVTDKDGKLLESFAAQPATPVLDPRNAFIMTTMMQGVVRYGTAAAASSLGRSDIAGKTGTTNDYRDAWFAGYNPDRVAVAWIGFDQPQSMGSGETGGKAALPIWMRYMSTALRGVPVRSYPVPEGVVVLNVDPYSGYRDAAGQPEFFLQEFTPARHAMDSEDSEELPAEEAPVMEGPGAETPAAEPPAAKEPDAP